MTRDDGRNDFLKNSGTISGAGGVAISGAVINTGTIIGTRLDGLNDSALDESVTNSGRITGGSIGVALGDANLLNTGTITGGTDGIKTQGYTITTSGLISGGVDAIYNSQGKLALIVDAGATFSGAVLDQTGQAGLTFAGTIPGHLDLGASFIGFSQITFDAAATWSVEGAADDLAAGQTISRFWGGDTLILDGFAATRASYVGGIGLELNNASAAVTLHTNAPLPGETFALTSQNGSSTLAVHGAVAKLVTLIGAPQATQVTPGAGNYAAAITITATGTIATGAAPAVVASAFSHLTNAGSISSAGTYNGGQDASYAIRNSAYVYNHGIITSENGVYGSNVLTNSGTIHAAGDYGVKGVEILVNSGLISAGEFGIGGLEPAAVIVNSGTIAGGAGAIQDSGLPYTLMVDPGAVFIGPVEGGGVLNLEPGTTAGSLNIGSFDGFGQLNFVHGAPWTLEGTAAQLATGQTITGFTQGDTIVLDGPAATLEIYTRNVGLLLVSSTATETLDIISTLSTGRFIVTDNEHGGTDISVACLLRGTRIATPRGNLRVEKLTIGDLANTMHGPRPIRWIGRRAYDGRFIANNPEALPIRIRRHAIAFNVPSRDLYVSPDHAICEGGVFIHAHLLQNGISITQPALSGDVEYFHLEFDTHTVIFAETLATESFIDEASGNRFQNAHTRPPTAPQKPCLPRVFEGFHLHNIKSRIAQRAGIKEPTTLGALRGVIDEHTPTLVRGWAQNSAAPEHPVTLEIISGRQKFLAIANAYRPDLRLAGIGSGCHGFSLTIPNLAGPVSICRAADGAALPPPASRHCESA